MRFSLATAVRAVVTYTLAGFTAAAAATVATVPLGGVSAPVLTAVWVSAAVSVGFPMVLLCDRITFGRKGGRP